MSSEHSPLLPKQIHEFTSLFEAQQEGLGCLLPGILKPVGQHHLLLHPMEPPNPLVHSPKPPVHPAAACSGDGLGTEVLDGDGSIEGTKAHVLVAEDLPRG